MTARFALVGMVLALSCTLAFAADKPAPKNVLLLQTSEAFAHSPTVGHPGH